MDAIASAVIGGASLTGGFGSIWGTLLGAVIIGVIRNGLNLLNVSSYLQQLILARSLSRRYYLTHIRIVRNSYKMI